MLQWRSSVDAAGRQLGFYGGITNKEIVEAFKIVENKGNENKGNENKGNENKEDENKKDARSKIKEAYEKKKAESIIDILEQCGIIEKETAKPQEQTNTDADSNQQEQASKEQTDGLESDGVDQ